MIKHAHRSSRIAFAALLWTIAFPAIGADPVDSSHVVSDVMDRFTGHTLNETILEAAKSLFWTLATVSLVWTMGLLIVRQDIGELLMELLRFIVVTGLFYWILVNASSRQGGEAFVDDIVRSFLQMASTSQGNETVLTNADSVLMRGLDVFHRVLLDTGDGQNADRLISGGLAVGILCICAVMAAQAFLALVMAWLLGYAGIFLLGFGGARWTSPIAVNYYKHVIAVGAALLTLSIIGTIAAGLLDTFGEEPNGRNYGRFMTLGMMLAISILMMLLSIKVPQLIYTLVTGSTLGIYAGSASAAGTAIAAAGNSAYAAAVGRLPGGGGGSGQGGSSTGAVGGAQSYRAESVIDAVQRSASAAGSMADPFHVNSGADPFGVGRAPDPHRSGGRGGSVFGDVQVPAAPIDAAASRIDTASESATTPELETSQAGTKSKNETTRGTSAISSAKSAGAQTYSGDNVDPARADVLGVADPSTGHATQASLAADVRTADVTAGSTAAVATKHRNDGRHPADLARGIEDTPAFQEQAAFEQRHETLTDTRVKAVTAQVSPHELAPEGAAPYTVRRQPGGAAPSVAASHVVPQANVSGVQPHEQHVPGRSASSQAASPTTTSASVPDAVPATVGLGDVQDLGGNGASRVRAPARDVAAHTSAIGTPSIIQEDMIAAGPVEEAVTELPGATSSPAPSVDVRGAGAMQGDKLAEEGEQPIRRKKRRLRRYDDEPLSSVALPPTVGHPPDIADPGPDGEPSPKAPT